MATKLTSSNVKYIVLHCSYTTPDMDIGRKEIDRWHRSQGWRKIGYHFVIRRDGTIETGREITEPGAHVEGHNSESIGVCLVGGAKEATERSTGKVYLRDDTSFVTPAQSAALEPLLGRLKEQFPNALIVGHVNLNPNKTCPVFAYKSWLKRHKLV